MGIDGKRHNLATLPPGNMTRYPLYRKLDCPQVQKNLAPTEIRSSDHQARSESL